MVAAFFLYSLLGLGIVFSIVEVLILGYTILSFFLRRNDEWLDENFLAIPVLLPLLNFFLVLICAAINAVSAVWIPSWLENILWICVIVNMAVLGIYVIGFVVFASVHISIELTQWTIESIRERVLLRRLISHILTFIALLIGFSALMLTLFVLAGLLSSEFSPNGHVYEPLGRIVADKNIPDGLYDLIVFTTLIAALIAAVCTVVITLRLRIPWNGDRARPPVAMVSDAGRIVADVVVRAANRSAGGRNDRPVFHGSERRAQEAAAGRRQFVADRSLEYRRSRPTAEILEIPPPLRGSMELRTLSEEDADATIVRLLYHRDDKSLLFDRVVDSVVSFGRDRGISLVSGTEIVLRSLHWWERLQGEYGWVAQVRTDHPNEIGQFLASIRDWLGIGVRTARPAGWASQRRCVYSGDVGTVAGRLTTRNSTTSYYLTCAHVVPQACVQVKLTRKSAKHAEEPDAALLHDHDCVQKRTSFRRVRFLTRRLLDELGGRQTPVERVGGYSQKLAGYVTSDLATYWAKDGEPERFSSCVVETLRIRKMWGWLPLPLFKGRFSAPGDSGSWVLARRSGEARPIWVGMITAGGKGDRRESCVVKSGPLLHYLRRRLRNEAPFTPHVIEDL